MLAAKADCDFAKKMNRPLTILLLGWVPSVIDWVAEEPLLVLVKDSSRSILGYSLSSRNILDD